MFFERLRLREKSDSSYWRQVLGLLGTDGAMLLTDTKPSCPYMGLIYPVKHSNDKLSEIPPDLGGIHISPPVSLRGRRVTMAVYRYYPHPDYPYDKQEERWVVGAKEEIREWGELMRPDEANIHLAIFNDRPPIKTIKQLYETRFDKWRELEGELGYCYRKLKVPCYPGSAIHRIEVSKILTGFRSRRKF
jgi:hypothetical protein